VSLRGRLIQEMTAALVAAALLAFVALQPQVGGRYVGAADGEGGGRNGEPLACCLVLF